MDTCARIRSGSGRGVDPWRTARLTVLVVTVPWIGSWAGLTASVREPGLDVQEWVVPRTPAGHPDLQGNWSNATATPIQRRQGMGPVFTREQVRAIESGLMSAREAASADSDPERGPPPVGGQFTGDPLFDAASGGTGGYNLFYIDPGERIAVFNGEPRTSLVVDPGNGRVPPIG